MNNIVIIFTIIYFDEFSFSLQQYDIIVNDDIVLFIIMIPHLQRKSSQKWKEFCKMQENNGYIRKAARAAGVPLWKIAAAIGISEPTLTRWLRFPLQEEKEQRIMAAIRELSQGVS